MQIRTHLFVSIDGFVADPNGLRRPHLHATRTFPDGSIEPTYTLVQAS